MHSCVKQCFNNCFINYDESNKRHRSQLPNQGANQTLDSFDSQWFNSKGVTNQIKYTELFFVGVVCCAVEVVLFWGCE